MTSPGLFITFEGIEGSGKSTQLRRAAAWLAERGHRVVTTREPGGTREGEAIRAMLLDPASELGGEAELFLYLADRAETMRQIIEPAVAMGAVVLGDRHADATLAYQGAMRGIGMARARDLNALATRGRRPDLTLLFDLDAAIGLGRAGGRRGAGAPDRVEAEAPAFHDGVRRAYLEIAAAEPGRIRVVDAAAGLEDVWTEVRRHLESILPAGAPA